MGCGMEDDARSPPVGVQDGDGVGGWCIDIEAEGPKRVGAVDEDVAQGHAPRRSAPLDPAVGPSAQTAGQLRYRHITEAQCRFADRVIGPQPTAQEVTRQVHARRFDVSHQVGEHVANPPAFTPGGGVPRRRLEGLETIGETVPQASDFLSNVNRLHDVESCKGFGGVHWTPVLGERSATPKGIVTPIRGVGPDMTVKATWNNAVVAESDHTILVEGNQYFPAAAVRAELLEKSDASTHCPWKGDASYYSIVVDGDRNVDAAWYYREPYEAAKDIKDYVAFWKGVEVTGTNENTPEIRPPGR